MVRGHLNDLPFVVSHPFRREREKDGARSGVDGAGLKTFSTFSGRTSALVRRVVSVLFRAVFQCLFFRRPDPREGRLRETTIGKRRRPGYFSKRKRGKDFHDYAIHTTGGSKRAQVSGAVHHGHHPVRHLRVPDQPEDVYKRQGIGGAEDAAFSNNGGDVLSRSYVEGGVADADAVGSQLLAAVMGDFER